MSDQLVADITAYFLGVLPAKSTLQDKKLILFSGVPGSGKSTVARAVEQELGAVRLCNDEVRERIASLRPTMSLQDREETKLKIATMLLERTLQAGPGLVVVDASCDRGYDFYAVRARKCGYHIILLRMDTPRHMVEQRILQRYNQNHKEAAPTLSQLDAWWMQWQDFGKNHKADLLIHPQTPLEDVIHFVKAA